MLFCVSTPPLLLLSLLCVYAEYTNYFARQFAVTCENLPPKEVNRHAALAPRESFAIFVKGLSDCKVIKVIPSEFFRDLIWIIGANRK